MAGFAFCITILISSFLLFMVQPLVGRMLLPSLGGTAAVWNTCVVFFQGLLLAGYGYSHYVSSRLKPRNQVKLHLVLLGLVCFFVPIRLFFWSDVPTNSDPTFWLLVQLAVMVGLPFFVISSNAPLIQRWYGIVSASRNDSTHNKRKNDPYFLYAFSNVGSLAALLAYPFVIEPRFGLTTQSLGWLSGFLLLIIGFLFCGWFVFTSRLEKTELRESPLPDVPRDHADVRTTAIWKQRAHWIVLAAIPSSLMLGVTTYLSTDVGSVPMLWVIPLAIYLLTFILAFARKQIIPHHLLVRISPILILLMAVLLLVDLGSNPWAIMPFHLLTFFVIGMVCHGEMNRLRPPVDRLTEFYLLMSVGGFIGGTFNALIAPNLFPEILEYPLALVAACLVRPQLGEHKNRFSMLDLVWPVGIAVFGILAIWLVESLGLESKLMTAAVLFLLPAIVCYSFVERPIRFALCFAVVIFSCQWALVEQHVVVTQRGFFGVNKVAVDRQAGFRMLINGRTMHGIQFLDPNRQLEPLSYYHRSGPVGDIFDVANAMNVNRVGVVGLGTGSIASYSKSGQTFDFYEIDPVVCDFASNPQYFNFLEHAPGDCRLILGDARVQLAKPIPASWRYDLLMIDAFSSDSIPTHLLTVEAFEVFRKRLNAGGVLAIHITNKHINLQPLLHGVAKAKGWNLLIRDDQIGGDHKDNDGKLSSTWVVFTFADTPASFANELRKQNWSTIDGPAIEPWTDERSNILEVLKW